MHPLAPYLSPEERVADFEAIVDAGEGSLRVYGESVEGRPLVAARFPSADPEADRAVMVCANIHGIEYIGNALAHRVARAFSTGDERFSRLRARAALWVIPCINPDGYARTWAAEGQGRAREMRWNARGVDLNRNFPMPWGKVPTSRPFAGASHPGAATYRGPAPLSEPETRHLVELLEEVRPHASVNLHSFMGTVITPRILERDDDDAYRALARAFRSGQLRARYPRLANRVVDVFTGEQEDYQHHVGRAWAACVEMFPVYASIAQHLRAPHAFARFNPKDPERWIENDLGGVAAFLDAALDRARPPAREGAATLRSTWAEDD